MIAYDKDLIENLKQIENDTKDYSFNQRADWIEKIEDKHPNEFSSIVADEEVALDNLVRKEAKNHHTSFLNFIHLQTIPLSIINWLNQHVAIQLSTGCLTSQLWKRILEDNYNASSKPKLNHYANHLNQNNLYDAHTPYGSTLNLDQVGQNF